jgi:hypothetical protein
MELLLMIAALLGLASVAVFLAAGVRLIRDRSAAAGPPTSTARAEAAQPSTRTIGDTFLTF